MKHHLWLATAALAAASLACSITLPEIPRLKTGPTQTFLVSEPLTGEQAVAAVTLTMGAGELHLTGGAEGLLVGEVRYNIPEWQPTLTREGDALTLQQGRPDESVGLPEAGVQVVNEWDLQLGGAPMSLTINAGAYRSRVDLSGVPVRSLEIKDGASDAEVLFASANPEEMEQLIYRTGASSVTLTGLAHANFADMIFESGAGDYTLDFSGELQRDAVVKITTGLSSLRLVIPAATAARVTVSGAINDVKTEGTWTASGDTYETLGSGPLLTIEVEMGVGTLTLASP